MSAAVEIATPHTTSYSRLTPRGWTFARAGERETVGPTFVHNGCESAYRTMAEQHRARGGAGTHNMHVALFDDAHTNPEWSPTLAARQCAQHVSFLATTCALARVDIRLDTADYAHDNVHIFRTALHRFAPFAWHVDRRAVATVGGLGIFLTGLGAFAFGGAAPDPLAFYTGTAVAGGGAALMQHADTWAVALPIVRVYAAALYLGRYHFPTTSLLGIHPGAEWDVRARSEYLP